MQCALDVPAIDDVSDPLSLRIQGWVSADLQEGDIIGIEALGDGEPIGRTSLLYAREDVSMALGIGLKKKTGFTILAATPTAVAKRRLLLALAAKFSDGRSEVFLEREIALSGRDYREGPWGVFLKPSFGFLVKREHMYNSGPSQSEGSLETLACLRKFLPQAPSSVLDIGCGLGFYGCHLIDAGYAWMGAELKQEDCAQLEKQGLPYCLVGKTGLPFPNESFDAAIAIEVLEHTDDPLAFVAEARRVVKNRFIVSVPNMELVAYWRAHNAVPWHLLESDHKSFFSRASLRELLVPHFRSVEIISYGEASLRSLEGARLGYHLMAIASV
ncbi:MAG: class I SAM-dependent methyltransferase [Opitutaceae bacterium]|jgi:SAM-dependent methyltransferase